VDFDDIIAIAAVLLKNIEWVMYKINCDIDHILLDEAQDTSPEQWEIVQAMADEFFATQQSSKTIFVVGDEKQSIYSFQGADVRVFGKMHQYFKNKSIASGQRFHEALLNVSHRSGGNILSFVDNVCGPLFQNVKHISHRSQDGGVVEVVDLFTDDADDDGVDDEPWSIIKNRREQQSASNKLATYIGHTINEAITTGVWVESRQRPAKASDFMILFQRRDLTIMKNIANALSTLNIPVCGLDRFLLEDELIVEDLIQLATFALFPADDLCCARVLKSPIVGMSEEDLLRACIDRTAKHLQLWDYLLQNEELCCRYDLRQLQSYLAGVFDKSALDFFMTIMTDGIKEKFINRLGEECLDALHAFLDVVMLYMDGNDAGLDGFLEWFRSFPHEIKRESFGQTNAVRLMTVHSSKGLQSPFVLLADCHFFRVPQNDVIMSDDGLVFWDFSGSLRAQKIEHLRRQYAALDLEESHRLLYVAMTRAEDFLYILGEQRATKLPENCWYNIIKRHMDERTFRHETKYNFPLLRSGYVQKCDPIAAESTTNHDAIEAIPDWFSQKLPMPSLTKISSNDESSGAAIYGECVHLLLSEMPKYLRWHNHEHISIDIDRLCQSIGDHLLMDFAISDAQKDAAKNEAFNVLCQKELEFLFDATALAEVPFIFENRDGRADKIAFKNDDIWIVDFKTTSFNSKDSQKDIPPAYIDQLLFYKNALENIPHLIKAADHKQYNIKIAILWTKSAQLQEICLKEDGLM
jgi:ATP-dependent helicase/nuclease subunit A